MEASFSLNVASELFGCTSLNTTFPANDYHSLGLDYASNSLEDGF